MKKTTTYKTLAGAYDAINKREAVAYDINGKDMQLFVDALKERKFTKAMTTVAMANTFVCDCDFNDATYTESIYVLKQTNEGFEWEYIGFIEDVNGTETAYFVSATKDADESKKPEKKPRESEKKPTPAKGNVKVVSFLTKAEKKAIRSECMKLAKGDRAKYDELCKARGVDNHR
jgi:hypothetical protein